MKYEMFILRSLLVASVMVCSLILGNMLGLSGSNAVQLAAPTTGVNATAAASITAGACALPPDGVLCAAAGT